MPGDSAEDGSLSEGALTREVMLRDVVRDVTAELAPNELPLLDGLDAVDDEAAARRFARGEKRETLAFGLGELAAMTSPVVWLALDEAARRLGEKSADGVARGTRAVVRRVLHRRAGPVRVPPLTPAQVIEVREAILTLSKERGLSAQRALAIADAVATRLALGLKQSTDSKPPGAASGADGSGQG